MCRRTSLSKAIIIICKRNRKKMSMPKALHLLRSKKSKVRNEISPCCLFTYRRKHTHIFEYDSFLSGKRWLRWSWVAREPRVSMLRIVKVTRLMLSNNNTTNVHKLSVEYDSISFAPTTFFYFYGSCCRLHVCIMSELAFLVLFLHLLWRWSQCVILCRLILLTRGWGEGESFTIKYAMKDRNNNKILLQHFLLRLLKHIYYLAHNSWDDANFISPERWRERQQWWKGDEKCVDGRKDEMRKGARQSDET